MGKTFDQSLIDTANIPMSMIDVEDVEDTSSEEFLGLRRVQQGCHTELCNRDDFPFNEATKTIKTIKDQTDYVAPEGTIKNIYIEGSSRPLYYKENIGFGSKLKGKPYSFNTKNDPERIVLYPTPDKVYNLDIIYNDTKNVIDISGELGYEIKVGSTLKMPERVQHLYFDALEYYVLYEYMRKLSNPRFEPTLEIFNRKWQSFLKNCQITDTETYFKL